MKAQMNKMAGFKLTALAALVAVAALSGCNKNGNGGGTYANVGNNGDVLANVPGPTAGSCLQPGYGGGYGQSNISPTYQADMSSSEVTLGDALDSRRDEGRHFAAGHGLHQYNWEPGFQGGAFPANGLCGCGAGLYPACGPQGLVCIPTQGFGGYQVATWGYQNGQFVGNGFNNGFAGYGGGGGSCANTVAQICTPGQTAPGTICQPVGSGSPYGAWVQQRP